MDVITLGNTASIVDIINKVLAYIVTASLCIILIDIVYRTYYKKKDNIH